MGDSFGDVGDEGADVGVLRNSWAICADVGVPYLAMCVRFSLRFPCIGGVAHAGEAACAGETARTGETVV